MGRYPWTICTRAYLKDVEVYFDETTIRRGLKIIGVALTELKKSGEATTTNPRNLTKQDIEAFLDWMKKRVVKENGIDRIGMRQATQANYMGYLQNLLRWVNNPVLEKMKVMNHVRFPQKVFVEIRAKSEETVGNMRRAIADMPGWEGSVAHFMVAVYAYSGLRRPELRLARIQDVDTQKWTIFVAHPKGERHCATPQVAPILPPAREEVLAFLNERRAYLESRGIAECEALVQVVRADYGL